MRLAIALCLLASPALALTDQELAEMKARHEALMLKVRQQQIVGMFGGVQDVSFCDPTDATCINPQSTPQPARPHAPHQAPDRP